jgi:bifunctional non-homologous end joining protein LigD
MVFDHDPGEGADMLDCIRVALRFRDILEQLGLKAFAKTSGGKGLHLYVPLNTPVTFDDTKVFSRAVAQVLEKEDPSRITTNMRKELRKGKVFVDWSQNDRHKTTVCAYSLRARSRPTVSTPVEWGELERALKKKDASALVFETADVLKRVKKKGDLFEPVLRVKQKLPRM